jgi:prophage regulatory protein
MQSDKPNFNTSSTTAVSLPNHGFVRLSSILAPLGPIPVGRSTWWAGVQSGRFPKPVKLGPRTTAWKVEDIRSLIEKTE